MNKPEIMNRYVARLNEKKEIMEADKVEKSKKISKKDAIFYFENALELIEDIVAEDGSAKFVNHGNYEKVEVKGKSGVTKFKDKPNYEWTTEDSWKVGFSVGKRFEDKVKGIYVEGKEKEEEVGDDV